MHSPNRSLHLLINERLNDEYSNQMVIIIMHYALIIMNYYLGGLAQLARAPALQAGGQRFESVILHSSFLHRLIVASLISFFDILTQARL